MTNEDGNLPKPDLEIVARSYLDAFEARDLERCLSFFDDDAVVDFQVAVFRGRKEIAGWHKDRFAADLKILRLESIAVNAETVVVDAVATSKRLAAWRIPSVSGRITMQFENGKIKHGKLTPRTANLINLIRGG